MTATILHVIEAMRHGFKCWSELHPYGSIAGAWREWLCAPR